MIKALYQEHILPRLVHLTCGLDVVRKQRKKIVPLARGSVLEIGIGSGHNLPWYRKEQIQQVVGIDPSRQLLEMSRAEQSEAAFPVYFLQASAECLPLASATFDTVLATYTLCSIPDILAALQEIRRVLRPEGQFLFCEHGRSPEEDVARWQNRLTPIWKPLSGGCHLNRDVTVLLQQNGFRIETLERYYVSGWKPFTYHYLGVARPE